ncbi:MAG: hypothetical protein NC313_11395 [Butyrivibrio sp.]|nr:hypothetical protein [Butyrivibrio sp.]
MIKSKIRMTRIKIAGAILIALALILVCIQAKASVGAPIFDGFSKMDYCLFLETEVGYGVTSDYYKYGIYGDFVKTAKEGEEIYFLLNDKMIRSKLNLNTHEEWESNVAPHIQNVSPDLEWVISRQYTAAIHTDYVDRLYYQNKEIAQREEYIYDDSMTFILKKTENNESYEVMDREKWYIAKDLIADIWGHYIVEERTAVSCIDEYGKLLAISEKSNDSIKIYDMDNWDLLHDIKIKDIDSDWPIEISQIVGNVEEGWLVFSNGDVTYKMTYPDGIMEKIGEFMYGTTYSPDGKYRAYCTGNIVLNDIWMELPDEKLDKFNSLYDRWEKIAPGWYVEELETGKVAYIPVETWEQDGRPLYSGRCVWIKRDELLDVLEEVRFLGREGNGLGFYPLVEKAVTESLAAWRETPVPETVWEEIITYGEHAYLAAFERISSVNVTPSDLYSGYADYRLAVKDEEGNIVSSQTFTDYPICMEEVYWVKDISSDDFPDIILCPYYVEGHAERSTELIFLIWDNEKITYEAKPLPWDTALDSPIWNEELSSLIFFYGDDEVREKMFTYRDGEWKLSGELAAENETEKENGDIEIVCGEYFYTDNQTIKNEIKVTLPEQELPWHDENSIWAAYNARNECLFPGRGWNTVNKKLKGGQIVWKYICNTDVPFLELDEADEAQSNEKTFCSISDFEDFHYYLLCKTYIGTTAPVNPLLNAFIGDGVETIEAGVEVYQKYMKPFRESDLVGDMELMDISVDCKLAVTYEGVTESVTTWRIFEGEKERQAADSRYENPFRVIKTDDAYAVVNKFDEKALYDKTGYNGDWIYNEYGDLAVGVKHYNYSDDTREIGIYDLENEEILWNFQVEGLLRLLQVQGDKESGKVIFRLDDRSFYELSYPSGDAKYLGKDMYCLSYSPDGKYAAYSSPCNEDFFDLDEEDYEELDRIPSGIYILEVETGKTAYIEMDIFDIVDWADMLDSRAFRWVEKESFEKVMEERE